jgi:hypothetical protein
MTNEEIARFNGNQAAAAGAAWNAWDSRRRTHNDNIKAWDDYRGGKYWEIRNGAASARKFTGEGINPTDQWCQNDFGQDWIASSRNANWANVGRMECKLSDGALDRISNAQATEVTTRDKGNRPGAFNEGEPKDTVGAYYHKPQIQFENINVQCCANILNVQGTARNNMQTCQQSIDQRLNSPTFVTPAPAESSETSVSTSGGSFNIANSITDNWEITGGISLLSFLCCCACFLIIVLLFLAK